MNETNRNISNPIPNQSDNFSTNKNRMLNSIVKYIKERSFSDSYWIKAISSQYFLIEIAQLLKLTTLPSYQHLEDEFFSTSCAFRKGMVLPEPSKILVVPYENEKLIKRMQQEDASGVRYPARLLADKINTQRKKDQIFYNYYYGLMAGTINRFCHTNPNVENYKVLRAATLNELMSEDALDEAGGWIHYRLPWITARVLISLSSYSKEDIDEILKSSIFKNVKIKTLEEYNDFIEEAAQSLIDRLHGKSIWESGAGDWVTCWESTGLCLEALLSCDLTEKYRRSVHKVFKCLFVDEYINKWLIKPSFENERYSNQTLASVIISSVIYRYSKLSYQSVDQELIERIELLFSDIVKIIRDIEEDKVQQYCTLPQILFYIVAAIHD